MSHRSAPGIYSVRCGVNVVVAALAVALVGCSDFLTGKVDLPTYAPVTSPPAPPSPSAVLPSGFPREVPVPRGLYRMGPGPVDKSVSLVVMGIATNSLGDAERLLLDAGYQRERVLGQEAYVGTRYVVLLAGDPGTGGGYRINYTVLDTSAVPGLPTMPSLTIPTLIPVPPAHDGSGQSRQAQ